MLAAQCLFPRSTSVAKHPLGFETPLIPICSDAVQQKFHIHEVLMFLMHIDLEFICLDNNIGSQTVGWNMLSIWA